MRGVSIGFDGCGVRNPAPQPFTRASAHTSVEHTREGHEGHRSCHPLGVKAVGGRA